MATCTVSGIFTDPSGTGIVGATVRFCTDTPAFDASSNAVMPKEVTTTTTTGGAWSISVVQGISGFLTIDLPPTSTGPAVKYKFSMIIPQTSTATFTTCWVDSTTFGGYAASALQFANIGGTVLPTQLPLFTSTLTGAVPASGGGTVNYLRADGTWAAPAGTPTYSTLGSFPAASTAGNGALGIALDTNLIYESNGSIWSLVAGPNTYVPLSSVGANNGVASLNSSGKVPLTQLPSNTFIYQGSWAPSTNTPTLVDGTGTAGSVYYVSAAYTGTVSGLNNASMTNFQLGDLAIYNGTQWELSSPANGVQSVNGSQGVVTVNAINQLTGDATAGPASGSASAALTLATVNSNVGTFTKVTVNGKGLVTAATTLASGDIPNNAANTSGTASNITGVAAVANGGTNNASMGVTAGGVLYTDGSKVQNTGAGTSGYFLQSQAAGAPVWAAAAAAPVAPTIQKFTSTGTQSGLLFTVTSANATVGATYTNNGHTYTVLSTIASGTTLFMSGTGSTSGSTLTKASGTGDSTITFSTNVALATYTTPTSPAPLYLEIEMAGGGGGGGNQGSGAGLTSGGPSVFGSALLQALGGSYCLNTNNPSPGGTVSIATGPIDLGSFQGGAGQEIISNGASGTLCSGGQGGVNAFGGNGGGIYNGGISGNTGGNGINGTGAGGGGGGSNGAAGASGGGGGAGGYIHAQINSPSATYYYTVGIGGTSTSGGAGGSGIVIVREYYQ